MSLSVSKRFAGGIGADEYLRTWEREHEGLTAAQKRAALAAEITEVEQEIALVSQIPAEVHTGLTVKDEGNLFLIKDREMSKPNALDQYHTGCYAGLRPYTDVEQTLREFSAEVLPGEARLFVAGREGDRKSAWAIQQISPYIASVEQTESTEPLAEGLRIARQAWMGRKATPPEHTWHGSLVCGIAWLLHEHPQVDRAVLVQALQMPKIPASAKAPEAVSLRTEPNPKHWLRYVNSRAKSEEGFGAGSRTRVKMAADVLGEFYNKVAPKSKRIEIG